MRVTLLLSFLLLQGCNFLEVRVDVVQRAILDKGDGTSDTYAKNGDTKTEEDKTTSVIKTIP